MRHNLNNESENTDRWLVSYADFITLLFAFFVVMYSVSQVNEGKFKILSETLTDAFLQPERSLQPIQIGEVNKADTTTSGEETYPADYMGEPAREETDLSFDALREELNDSLKELVDANLVKIRSNQDWIEIDIGSKMLFSSGSDELSQTAAPLLKLISEKNLNKKNAIKIRGYTDNVKINTRLFSSNWALSSARAVAVAMVFEKNGIAANRMTAEGYGEHQPVADNSTAIGRRQNRRVVLAFSRYAPAKSELERTAIENAANESLQPLLENEDDALQIILIRAADGSLIIRGRKQSDTKSDEQENDSSVN